ncbi:HEAT repeat domain-containing protein [Natranaerobius trueperi]|uniref:HEAT repeat domain-containing protein n=1 Tax=Natranaerobius trueperi TaxID=759412 RepID=A0A226C0Z0_9FIRM|nr:HEAT repeat domain-containing protein [Natranaerobius trueperi]OWZ84831.1 hypothetical protein CDO51_00025 [Natranaerobius trueperi]
MTMFNLLIVVIIVMIISIVSLLLFVLINHYLLWVKEHAYQKKSNAWETVLYSYLADEISVSEAAKKMKGDYFDLWSFLKPYLDNLMGQDREKLVYLIKETGMTDYFLNKAKKANRKKRLISITILGKLGDKRALPILKKMLKSPKTMEMVIAAKAIADTKEVNLVLPVFRRMLINTNTTFEGITEIAVRFGKDVCTPINNIIQEWLEGQRNLEEDFGVSIDQSVSLMVDILGYYRFTKAAPQLGKILTNVDDNEVIIHVLKALSRIEYPTTVSLTPFIYHENWIIRSQVAKYIGKVKEDTYRDDMKNILNDDNWWVRFYAAKALYDLGYISYLNSISNSKDHRGEISRYILSKV